MAALRQERSRTYKKARSAPTRPTRFGGARPSLRLSRPLRIVIIIALSLACLAAAYAVLSLTPLFTIEHLVIDRTEHVSEDAVAKLAHIEAGTTLLNLDEEAIKSQIEQNPWVGTVDLKREFPSTLHITVSERSIAAIVYMNTNNVAWYLADNYKWIEPATLGKSAGDAALLSEYLSRARELGCLLICDVAPELTPEAGVVLSDETLLGVLEYQESFSPELSQRIVSYSAPSLEAISCTLQEGVTVSLGAPTDITVKEAIIKQLLDAYAGQITYINVRVPHKPSYRKLDTDNVVQGNVDENLMSLDGELSQLPSGEAPSEESSTQEETSTEDRAIEHSDVREESMAADSEALSGEGQTLEESDSQVG